MALDYKKSAGLGSGFADVSHDLLVMIGRHSLFGGNSIAYRVSSYNQPSRNTLSPLRHVSEPSARQIVCHRNGYDNEKPDESKRNTELGQP